MRVFLGARRVEQLWIKDLANVNAPMEFLWGFYSESYASTRRSFRISLYMKIN